MKIKIFAFKFRFSRQFIDFRNNLLRVRRKIKVFISKPDDQLGWCHDFQFSCVVQAAVTHTLVIVDLIKLMEIWKDQRVRVFGTGKGHQRNLGHPWMLIAPLDLVISDYMTSIDRTLAVMIHLVDNRQVHRHLSKYTWRRMEFFAWKRKQTPCAWVERLHSDESSMMDECPLHSTIVQLQSIQLSCCPIFRSVSTSTSIFLKHEP